MTSFKTKLKKIEYNNFYPLFFTVIFILIVIQYSFSTLDAIFYDLWVRSDVVAQWDDNIIEIVLDEESDEFLGEMYPYTYATHTRFVKKILKDSPLLVNYFVQLNEPETEIEKKYYEEFSDELIKYTKNDGSFRFGTTIDAWGEQELPEKLKSIGYSLGILHIDSQVFSRDDISRRAVLNISGEDSIHLWTANKFREAQGKEKLDSNSYQGSYYNREADATFAHFRYFSNPINEKTRIKKIPYHRVVVGNFPKGFFRNKIILIGSEYISNSADFILTPFNQNKLVVPKLNVHANIIQSLIKNKTIYKLPDLVTDIISILLALFLSYIISKVSPTKGLMITMSIMIGIFIVAFLLFTGFGVWIKISHLFLCVCIVYYIWVPFRAIGEYQTRYKMQEESKLLKKVDNLKQNFISLMSHDLKTPVAKIHGIADILKVQYENTAEQTGMLQSITNATKELNNFISSILDLTKIESENLDLRMVSKDVTKIIEDIINRLKYEAKQCEIEIATDFSPLYPIQLDVTLMNRVISNLVENAIKYSGKGSVIDVSTWDDEEWVYIKIKDNGVGIAPEDLESIFDKFYRVKNDSSHKIKGSGLGLYLVKYFIELHDGKIQAESGLGEGTTFVVSLKNA